MSDPAIDAYIEACEEPSRSRLRELAALIRRCAPAAIEKMAYGLPTWWDGENLVHIGAAARHVGLYPGPRAIEVFAGELNDLPTSKGAIQLLHDRELPLDLVERIVRWRVKAAGDKHR